MCRINRRKVKGPTDWTAQHTPYIAMWNVRSRQHYLHGARHRSGPWVDYLRWLQVQSQLFLRLAYTKDDIAQLPDSDSDNEVVDEYDELTWCGTVQLERGPFQNYMVSTFLYIHCLHSLKLKFLILTNVIQAAQLGWFTNKAGNALNYPPNSAASHNVLRAFAEVSMVCIFLVHHNVSSN
jgi:hypothetical protein